MPTHVALLAEGVDRNESMQFNAGIVVNVALLAEGVDRNQAVVAWKSNRIGRPPRGGRG